MALELHPDKNKNEDIEFIKINLDDIGDEVKISANELFILEPILEE